MSDLELTMMRRVGELNKENARLKAEVERLTEGGDLLLNMLIWTDEYSSDRCNDAKEKWLTAKTGKQPWQR